MTVQTSGGGGGAIDRPSSSSLADVVDTILDKGLVIDAYVRVSLIGIELLTIDARIVIASVDTYLRFAEAANRLDLAQSGNSQGLPDLLHGGQQQGNQQQGVEQGKGQAAIEGVTDKLNELTDQVQQLAQPGRQRSGEGE
ncbi:MAG TPA: gas vesicle protein GvpJ [Micromonosporaceae bacterium]